MHPYDVGERLHQGEDAFNERYSETSFREKEAGRKVFNAIGDDVARERATITAGRTFTWGGRMKLDLPAFNPNRERMLRHNVQF